MANNITNTLKINADKDHIHEILTAIKNDEFGIGSIDFNKIIPIPEIMDILKNPDAQTALKYYQSCMQACAEALMSGESPSEIVYKQRMFHQNKPEMWNLGKECYSTIKRYGTGNELDINRKMWSSKWNAFGYTKSPKYEEGSDTIRFLSANERVSKVIEKLSEMFPDTEFLYRWADENMGDNVGEAKYENGECIKEHIPVNNSIEAYELAFDIIGVTTEGVDADWMISADETKYVPMGNDFDLMYIKGIPVMFSETILAESDIPKGMNLYKLDMMSGSVISKIPMNIDKNNCIILESPDEYLNFTDKYISFKDYNKMDINAEMIALEKLKTSLADIYKFTADYEPDIVRNAIRENNREFAGEVPYVLEVGCVSIETEIIYNENRLYADYNICVKIDESDSDNWRTYDSLPEEVNFDVQDIESKMLCLLDAYVSEQGLSYTECNGQQFTKRMQEFTHNPPTAHEQLREKLKNNFTEYMNEHIKLPPEELFKRAEKIAQVKMIYNDLINTDYGEQTEYLLRFKNPIEVVICQIETDQALGIDCENDVSHAMWRIFDMQDMEAEHELDETYIPPDESQGMGM